MSKPASAISRRRRSAAAAECHKLKNKTVKRGTVILMALASFSGLCDAVQSQSSPKSLLPRQPADLRLQFSPNGHYVLAQDDSGVTVLTVQPFRALFRTHVQDAGLACFTPDSRQVVFVVSLASLRLADPSSPARLERWNIADRTHAESAEIRLHGCGTMALSPNGRAFACVDFFGTLRLLDVSSGETILERKQFARKVVIWAQDAPYRRLTRYEIGEPESAQIGFSPDGRFLIAYPWNLEGTPLAFDLEQRKTVNLVGGMKKLSSFSVDNSFAFVAPDRVMMSQVQVGPRAVTAALMAFPSGQVLSTPKLPPGPVSRASDPGFVLIRPCGPFPRRVPFDPHTKRTCAVEFSTGRLIVSKTPALDVFGDHYVAERVNGEIGLYERGKPAAVATVRLDAP
jgi:WD40 repeat protein